jgi:hypothetical protein
MEVAVINIPITTAYYNSLCQMFGEEFPDILAKEIYATGLIGIAGIEPGELIGMAWDVETFAHITWLKYEFGFESAELPAIERREVTTLLATIITKLIMNAK